MNLSDWKNVALGALACAGGIFTAAAVVECTSCVPTHVRQRYKSDESYAKDNEALALVESSMMKINCTSSGGGGSSASSVVFRTFSNGDTYLLTANHVMGYDRQCFVNVSAQSYPLKMESRYDAADIAIVSTNIPNARVYAVPFLFDVKADLDIVSMGFSGSQMFYSFGHVIEVQHRKKAGALVEIYAIHAYIRPGNSGGPVTDDHGRIIGVNMSWESQYAWIGNVDAAKNLQPQLEMILAAPDRPSFPVLPVVSVPAISDVGSFCTADGGGAPDAGACHPQQLLR
ncbi:trypsin-like peptidase domain-containing protein [Candidatus Woesearchaeota archaeon]|nr:trypsin-like peptidase domain-containing protein [Candidatus Woesearchaeota archaeon]